MNKYSIVALALTGTSLLIEILAGIVNDKGTEADIREMVQEEVAKATDNKPRAVIYDMPKKRNSK